MPETILTCIKQMLGLTEDYTPFDRELVMHINSVLMILNQLGVGMENFRITLSQTPGDNPQWVSTETWNSFFGSNYIGDKEAVKSYIYTKVKLLFDPPASGVLMESYQKLADEFEFRLNVAAGV
ncbi:MAG: hypothetical protein IKD62_02230 [Oscillospiraceae bacterium]|nr:hypothetical protein [Oscillospiraceae bacterium]MBR3585544.1 hypothetical protein [Oscillospiraceae bacterium]